MSGIRHVIHVAADYRLWARDRSEIFASNVNGTRIVMQEAMRAGVERVIDVGDRESVDVNRLRRTE